MDFTSLMREALIEAEVASNQGEVPIGAVVSVDNTIIGRGHNLVESRRDPTAHAEIIALRDAASRVSNWRLNSAVLVVTVEPCTMCVGAAKLARVPTIVFGASEKKTGACGSLYDLSLKYGESFEQRVVRGVLEEESLMLMQRFFERLRGAD